MNAWQQGRLDYALHILNSEITSKEFEERKKEALFSLYETCEMCRFGANGDGRCIERLCDITRQKQYIKSLALPRVSHVKENIEALEHAMSIQEDIVVMPKVRKARQRKDEAKKIIVIMIDGKSCRFEKYTRKRK
jgi:hypothetical protein